jgi:hypothetical protein
VHRRILHKSEAVHAWQCKRHPNPTPQPLRTHLPAGMRNTSPLSMSAMARRKALESSVLPSPFAPYDLTLCVDW